MDRPPETLKSTANRLAGIVSNQDGAGLVKLLERTGLLATSPTSVPGKVDGNRGNGSAAKRANRERVGIWERTSEPGRHSFVRSPEMMSEWGLWASVGRIDAKGAKRRVVLIGESVARGFLYDPVFTPARALETILRTRMGQAKVEVVDLARTNLEGDVNQLAMSAYSLEPDAVVIFAGNNWRGAYGNIRSLNDIEEPIAVLQEQGIGGLKRYLEGRIAAGINQLVNEITTFFADKGIPVVWITPEFNLGDWRDSATSAPHLPKQANRAWSEYLERADHALQIGDIKLAADLAARMVELDGGICATGLYLLAECSSQIGDREARRRYLEMARDAPIWDFTNRNVSPRSYTVVQETLRSATARYQNNHVDLPRIFKEYLGGDVPDRRLFMDYCHLNSEGIRLAMSAVASDLLKLLEGIDAPWTALNDERIKPSPEVEGEAAFLAAIHNAHWWQSYELVEYYCLRALEKAPGICKAMTQFIDLQSRRTPMLMCKSAEALARSGSPLVQNYILRSNAQRLDRVLIDAISGALARSGIKINELLDQLRQAECSVVHKDVDLLDLYYCSAGQQPQELAWRQPKAQTSVLSTRSDYYRAYHPESRFVFVGQAGCAVLLRLTCRLPESATSEGAISIEVNGERVSEEEVGCQWETREITVDWCRLTTGLNDVVIQWPQPVLSGEEALEKAIRELIHGNYPEFFPVFGEIHSFVVSAAHPTIGTEP